MRLFIERMMEMLDVRGLFAPVMRTNRIYAEGLNSRCLPCGISGFQSGFNVPDAEVVEIETIGLARLQGFETKMRLCYLKKNFIFCHGRLPQRPRCRAMAAL